MTTSQATNELLHPLIRALIDAANALPLPDRLTLMKGLIPGIADELSEQEFDAFAMELGLKGTRFYEALSHPGEGRDTRLVPGERELEGR